jgi:hypothetical protein
MHPADSSKAGAVGINRARVPHDLVREGGRTYLEHQTGLWFEDYFRRFVNGWSGEHTEIFRGGWAYLPIGWTALEARYRALPRFARKYLGLHSWLYRRVDRVAAACCARHPNVFTVCQHARGVEIDRRVRRPDKLLVFSCGGSGHVPLPLICDKRDVENVPRDLLASFQGVVRHARHDYPWREAMAREFQAKPGCVVVDTEGVGGREDYMTLLARSRFGLCPRGYGRTSFRLVEVMHAGCVPVYIHAGDAWLPYQEFLDWSEFCVLVDYRKIDGLRAYLASLPEGQVSVMARRAKEVSDRYFTMEYASRYVLERLANWAGLGMEEIIRRTEILRGQRCRDHYTGE